MWSSGRPLAPTLLLRVTSEGGRNCFFLSSFLFHLQMHGGLIKLCGPARLMGLIAYYAGPYIMSNRLLLSLPVNEASHTSMGEREREEAAIALRKIERCVIAVLYQVKYMYFF